MNASTCKRLFDPMLIYFNFSSGTTEVSFSDISPTWLNDINDPDISGVGILAAFTFSACAQWVLAITLLVCGLIPAEQLAAIDRRFYGIRTRRMPRIEKALIQTMKALSDQQIVTGIAILVAAIARVNSLSAYHWKTVASLGWLSSSVHLLSLSTLRPLLSRNRGIVLWRVFGMLVLCVLLIIVMLPTRTIAFNSYYSRLQNIGPDWPLTPQLYGISIAMILPGTASCFWHQAGWQTKGWSNFLQVFWACSIAFLIFLYAWKCSQLLFKGFPRLLVSCFHLPHRICMHILHRAARRMLRDPKKSSRLQFRIILIPYLLIRSFWDLAESYVVTIEILTISLISGLLRLWLSISWPMRKAFKEHEWTFGQLVVVVLCVLPFFLLFEELWCPEKAEKKSTRTSSAPGPAATPATLSLSSILAGENPNELLLGTWTGRTAVAIENCLYNSKLYKALLVWYHLVAISQWAIILAFYTFTGLLYVPFPVGEDVAFALQVLSPTLVFFVCTPLLLLVAFPFSKLSK